MPSLRQLLIKPPLTKTWPKVSLYSVPSDLPHKMGEGDGNETQFGTYINFAATLGQRYDLILDDGRARLEVR